MPRRATRTPLRLRLDGSDGTAKEIQHAFAQGAGGLFTLRESRRGDHELCQTWLRSVRNFGKTHFRRIATFDFLTPIFFFDFVFRCFYSFS